MPSEEEAQEAKRFLQKVERELWAKVRAHDEELEFLDIMKSELRDICALSKSGQIPPDEANARIDAINKYLDKGEREER
jgi:hypothetical protein